MIFSHFDGRQYPKTPYLGIFGHNCLYFPIFGRIGGIYAVATYSEGEMVIRGHDKFKGWSQTRSNMGVQNLDPHNSVEKKFGPPYFSPKIISDPHISEPYFQQKLPSSPKNWYPHISPVKKFIPPYFGWKKFQSPLFIYEKNLDPYNSTQKRFHPTGYPAFYETGPLGWSYTGSRLISAVTFFPYWAIKSNIGPLKSKRHQMQKQRHGDSQFYLCFDMIISFDLHHNTSATANVQTHLAFHFQTIERSYCLSRRCYDENSIYRRYESRFVSCRINDFHNYPLLDRWLIINHERRQAGSDRWVTGGRRIFAPHDNTTWGPLDLVLISGSFLVWILPRTEVPGKEKSIFYRVSQKERNPLSWPGIVHFSIK